MIHTLTRDINELMEAMIKWIPIYTSGAIEPYYYPRLRDGLFQRTLFIAPKTAAITSSSVQNHTEGMLNQLITDGRAIEALSKEYDRYFDLCRPLMKIYTESDMHRFANVMELFRQEKGDVCIRCKVPPLFVIPESVINMSGDKNSELYKLWKSSVSIFRSSVKRNQINISILNPKTALKNPQNLTPSFVSLFTEEKFIYSVQQYNDLTEQLKKLERRYENLHVYMHENTAEDTFLYAK
ncbi:Hypothetical protein ING2D1G_1300 [Peptoniphilus sp. ING2-D1G]|nr:Hypothetical protein ING2D1G_1300 [Peptoniphilus sp. ING2-D1G]